jgi:Cu-Zn family superoxide dismutase
MKTSNAFCHLLAFSLLSAACSQTAVLGAEHEKEHASAWESVKEAIAVIHPTAGNKAHGQVRFTESGNKIKVVAHIEGLMPNQKHAIHIHEFGDCSAPDAASAGSHYNPEGHSHGLADNPKRHAGDLGNLQADSQGKAHYELTVDNITIAGLKNAIIGRAVIVHAKPDDGGQPVGNAGGRIACGIIGIAQGQGPGAAKKQAK